MKLTQNSWPPDIKKEDSPYPGWMVGLANRSRFRTRFWLSPVGIGIIVLLYLGFFLADRFLR